MFVLNFKSFVGTNSVLVNETKDFNNPLIGKFKYLSYEYSLYHVLLRKLLTKSPTKSVKQRNAVQEVFQNRKLYWYWFNLEGIVWVIIVEQISLSSCFK